LVHQVHRVAEREPVLGSAWLYEPPAPPWPNARGFGPSGSSRRREEEAERDPRRGAAAPRRGRFTCFGARALDRLARQQAHAERSPPFASGA
jgi:hypothetical protein